VAQADQAELITRRWCEGHRTAGRERGKLGRATRQVVAEATRTLRGVTSVWVKEFQATVENDQVKNYRVTAKVSFVMERT
jgi:flavin-binding protein dodecin